MGLAACGGDDSTGASTTDPPRTESPSTTLAPAEQAEAEVRAAYDAYWAMSERLAAAPDPNDPEIAERTTGGARDALTTRLTQLMTEGLAIIFADGNAHTVTSVRTEDTTARLRDCHVDAAMQVDVASRQIVEEATSTFLLEVTLTLEGNSWKVSRLSDIDSWAGSVPCG